MSFCHALLVSGSIFSDVISEIDVSFSILTFEKSDPTGWNEKSNEASSSLISCLILLALNTSFKAPVSNLVINRLYQNLLLPLLLNQEEIPLQGCQRNIN